MTDSEKQELNLFREEAVGVRQSDWLGEVVFSRPLGFHIMAIFAVCLILAIVLLGYFGSYTKTNTVVGQIEPDSGVIKVYPTQSGIVLESYVTEGKEVGKGDALFLVSSDKTSANGEIQAVISSDVQARKALLIEQIKKTRSLQAQDHAGLLEKIDNYKREISVIDGMSKIQNDRVAVATDIANRYQALLASNYVSEADVQAKQADLLDQRSRLTAVERDRTSTLRDLNSAKVDLQDLSLKTENSLADLSRQLHSANEDLSASESRRELVIKAPSAGTATTIVAKVGQVVETNEALVSILPKSTALLAILYATSKAIGFVDIGDEVELRYEAYSYQQYGTYSGKIISISRTALTPGELTGISDLLIQRSDPVDRSAPLYRITVALESESVLAHGKEQKLQAGMLLEADIVQDTRRLYQWALEPLYALDAPEL